MKKIAACVFLSVLNLWGCAHEIPLSHRNIANFKVSDISTGTEKALEISGLVFHSAYTVGRTDIHHENEVATIGVFLTPAKDGQTGTFLFQVKFPDAIREVRFGEDRKLIYRFD